jgi:hypothetical protein
MTDLRTAAQEALEALKLAIGVLSDEDETESNAVRASIKAIKTALAEPEQEPVAWMVYTQDGKSVCVTDNPADFIEWRSFPLYTHPPRREWRSLSDEELTALGIIHSRYQEESLETGGWFDFARAVEAVLRSKNHD